MGVVYEAEDTRLGRHVALKFLPEGIEDDPIASERFLREARTSSALNHPNVCTIYGVEEHAGRHFIAMELLEGQTLDCLVDGNPLLIQSLLDYALQVADALHYAHSRGVVHRDIKPSNIFITNNGQAKVLDFGLAWMHTVSMEPSATHAAVLATRITAEGIAVGTVAYMSPQQARGEQIDHRSDLFSFGATLYEAATGQLPFKGATSAVVFDAILNRDPTPPSRLNSSVPDGLQGIIQKCLEKELDLRYQTSAELRADLKRVKRDSAPSGHHPVNYPENTPQRSGSSSAILLQEVQRHKLGTIVVSFMVLAVGVAAIFGLWSFARSRTSNHPFATFTIRTIMSASNIGLATISPDGKYVLYVVSQAGQHSLTWPQKVRHRSCRQPIIGGSTASRSLRMETIFYSASRMLPGQGSAH